MAQDEGQQQSDQLGENWLNNFESQCLQELDAEPNMEERLQTEREYAAQKLWSAFQNSATAIAQMYRGNRIKQDWDLFEVIVSSIQKHV